MEFQKGYVDYYHEFAGNDVRLILATKSVCRKIPDLLTLSTKSLETADAVWFEGGDQDNLFHLIQGDKPNSFRDAVQRVVGRGGAVGGTSAGTAILSEVIFRGIDDDGNPRIGVGLGVLANVIVDQHLDGRGRAGRIERFSKLLRNTNTLMRHYRTQAPQPWEILGVAVEEETEAAFHGDKLSALGPGRVHVVLKDRESETYAWHILKNGESATVQLSDRGLLLQRENKMSQQPLKAE